ncbi:MAG: glycosidase, partial [Verrucomicrobia bacterium]|nr:glycosidase [Verrucomicrobiota bacterium]
MNAVRLRRHDFWIAPQNSRVLLRPFIPAEVHRITSTLGRVLALTEEEVAQELAQVLKDFEFRHRNLGALLLANFQRVQGRVLSQTALSEKRKLLLGALFSGEYALESAAIFNPSIVPHPDQSGVAQGAVRFLMSLRATGEGHISSIEFRTGIISPSGELSMDPISHYVTAPEIVANPSYKKKLFSIKLAEMGFDRTDASAVMAPLGETFTLVELTKVLRAVREETKSKTHDRKRMLECIQWLADSNYELHFSEKLPLSEQIIYPVSSNETNGMEDARFVRFIEDDGSVMYYATYTAYNGRSILPQFIETLDFINFRILTL